MNDITAQAKISKSRLPGYRRKLGLVASFATLFSLTLSLHLFAAPPGSPYAAGETLDPSCAPGDANCSVEIVDDTLGAIASLVTAADTGIYYTGQDTASTYTLTAFGRSILDDADASAARTTLGLAIGSDVQAHSSVLANAASSNLRIDANTLSSASGALILEPLAGQSLNVNLSTTGDFAVNTDDLYVDTSTGRVGVGTSAPERSLHVVGNGIISERANGTPQLVLRTTGGAAGTKDWRFSVNSVNGYFGIADTDNNTRFTIESGSIGLLYFSASGNLGIGTTTPAARLHALSTTEQLRLGYDTSNYYSTTVDADGTVTFDATGAGAGFVFSDDVTLAGDIDITGSIIPSADITYDLGSPTRQWRDVYIGPGSLYINGQKVLEESGSDIIVSADEDQNLSIQTSGTGNVELNPTDTGQILLKGPINVTAGKAFSSTDGNPIDFDDGIRGGNIAISDNEIRAMNTNGGISLVPAGNGGVYVESGNFGIGTTDPAAKLHIAGSADVEQLIIQANATQSNTNPLVMLANSSGTELARVHTDSTTNFFAGYLAGNANTVTGTGSEGLDNVFIGSEVGKLNTTGFRNVGIGRLAFSANTTGNDNVAVGYRALEANTSGINNTALGFETLFANTTGEENIAIGVRALYANTTGTYNIALGRGALDAITTGADNNVAIGQNALGSSTAGDDNIAIGQGALGNAALTAGQNIAIGSGTLRQSTSGTNNSALGYSSILFNTTGSYNAAIGYYSGRTATDANANTTGSYNTFLGSYAGPGTATQLTNATAIGARAVVSQDNSIVLGSIDGVNGATASARVGIGATAPSAKLHILTADEQLRLGYDTTNYWSDTIASDGGRTIAGFGTDADLNIAFGGATDGDFSVNTDDLFVDTSTGNVGIGTTTPSEMLELGNGGKLQFNDATGARTATFEHLSAQNFKIATSGGGIELFTGATRKWFVGSGAGASFQNTHLSIVSGSSGSSNLSNGQLYVEGNTGIGTDTISARLHVASTTEQLRLAYGALNYWTHTVASDGGLTLAGFGTDADLNIAFGGATDGDFSVNTDDLFVDTSTGRVGVGTASPGNALHVGGTTDATIRAGGSHTGNANEQSSVLINGTLSGANTYNSIGRGYHGLMVSPTANSGSSATNFNGAYIIPTVFNSTLTESTGLQAYAGYSFSGNTAAITTAKGVWIKSWGGVVPSTFGTQYGLYIDNITGASTNYAIYAAGGQNYFGGNLGIGDTTPDGKLDVEYTGAVTATNYGINLSNLTTNTTTDAIDKYGLYITSTGSFTGSTGTATNNYGLYVDTPTGGDNNYAAIFEGGNVGIGTTTPAAPLSVVDDSGYVLIGSVSTGYGGLGFASSLSGTNFSLIGNGTDTYLNAPTGGTVYLRINNASTNQAAFADAGGYAQLTLTGASGGVLANSTGDFFVDNRSAAGHIIFRTTGSSTERMRITSDGNVGIGTTDPNTFQWGTSLAVINGSTHGIVDIAGAGSSRITLRDTSQGANQKVFELLNSSAAFSINRISDDAGTRTEYLNLSSAGNLGVGTNVTATVRFTSKGATSDNNAYAIRALNSSDAELFIVRNDGNVGIGTVNPQHTLHVAGNDTSGIGITALVENTASSGNAYAIFAMNTLGSRYGSFFGGPAIDSYGIVNGITMGPGTDSQDIGFRTGAQLNGSGSGPSMIINASGNLGLGTTSFGTSAAKVLAIGNGTAPTTSPADSIQLYAEDVSASSELKVRDEAGNITTLSPHNFSLIPDGPSEFLAWSFYSERDGKSINVDMLRTVRLVEQLANEKLVHLTETAYEFDPAGGMSVIEAIEDLDLAIQGIRDFEDETFLGKIREWLASAGNGIQTLFAKELRTERICIGETCIESEEELQELKALLGEQAEERNAASGGSEAGEVAPPPAPSSQGGGEPEGPADPSLQGTGEPAEPAGETADEAPAEADGETLDAESDQPGVAPPPAPSSQGGGESAPAAEETAEAATAESGSSEG